MRKLLIFLSLSVLAGGVSAQPELPHRVYGQVTDGGSPVEGVNVTASCSDCSSVTGSDGFYDLDLTGSSYSYGERVYILVSGQNSSRYVNFTSGASERMDFSGSFDSSGSQENDTGTSPGGGSTSGSGGGGGGTSSGGSPGGSAPSGGTDSQEELSFEVSLDENGSASLEIGELRQGQRINVRVNGETYLEGFSFEAGSDSNSVSANIVSRLERPSGVSVPGFDVFRFYRIDLDGLNQYSGASVSYQLSKPWLVSRSNSSDDFVFSTYSGSWERLSSSVVTESLSVYSLESGVSSFGLFATGLEKSRSDSSGGLEVTDFSVRSSESDPFRVDITATVINQGNSTVSENLTLYSGQRSLEVAEVSLGPNQSRVFSFSSNLSAPGPHSFRFGSETATVTVNSPGSDDGGGKLSLVLLGVVGSVFLVLTVLVGYIYFIEYRRAKELDETVDYLERQSDRVGDRMEDVRRDLNRMQSQLGRRDRDERDQR